MLNSFWAPLLYGFSYFQLWNKQEEHMDKEVVSILPPKARFSTVQSSSICEEVKLSI